ncbi:hypothetical protein BH23BAC4_BH23BAC4_16430 [soil metagenome]
MPRPVVHAGACVAQRPKVGRPILVLAHLHIPSVLTADIEERLCDLAEGADLDGVE